MSVRITKPPGEATTRVDESAVLRERWHITHGARRAAAAGPAPNANSPEGNVYGIGTSQGRHGWNGEIEKWPSAG